MSELWYVGNSSRSETQIQQHYYCIGILICWKLKITRIFIIFRYVGNSNMSEFLVRILIDQNFYYDGILMLGFLLCYNWCVTNFDKIRISICHNYCYGRVLVCQNFCHVGIPVFQNLHLSDIPEWQNVHHVRSLICLNFWYVGFVISKFNILEFLLCQNYHHIRIAVLQTFHCAGIPICCNFHWVIISM